MTNAFGVDQSHYRFAEEDGTQATSTLLGSEDTALTRLVATDSNIQLRILMNEVGSGSIAGATNASWQLQRSIAGGAFANVTTTSTGAKVNTGSQLTDGGTTTNRLTAIGTFSAGQQDDQNGIVVFTHPANNCTEHVFGLTLVAADLAEGNAVTFQLLYQGAVITDPNTQGGSYNVTPTLNITKAVNFTATPTAGAIRIAGQTARLPGATAFAAENANATLTVDTTYRIRVRVENTGGAGVTGYQWRYNHNSGGWNDITTSSLNVRAVSASGFANDQDVEEVLTGAQTYTTNNDAASTDGSTTLPAAFGANTAIEFLLAYQLRSADVANGQTGQIRLEYAGSPTLVLDAYTNTFTYTVTGVAAAGSLVFPVMSPAMTSFLIR